MGRLAPGPDHQTVPVTALVRSSTVSSGQMAAQVLLPLLISSGIPAEVPQFFYLSNGIIFIFYNFAQIILAFSLLFISSVV